PRFQPGNFEINLQLVKQGEEMAAKRGCTPAQLALGWVTSLQRRPGVPTIIPIPGGTTAGKVRENAKRIDLNDEEMDALDATLAKFEVAGGRYPDNMLIDT
ncbi:NADP-dependent oxidoreductase domain-containing protein, partial [Dactylonectria estremocensis]